MDYAAYVYDVEHVVIDNLQFMLSGQVRGSRGRGLGRPGGVGVSACVVVTVYGCQRVWLSACAVVGWLAYLVTLVVSITDAPRAVLCRQGGRGFDKFHILDEAVEAFRAFATQRNVHVTLVVHPRKEADGVALNTGPIGGVFPCLLWRWLLLGTCGPLAG